MVPNLLVSALTNAAGLWDFECLLRHNKNLIISVVGRPPLHISLPHRSSVLSAFCSPCYMVPSLPLVTCLFA